MTAFPGNEHLQFGCIGTGAMAEALMRGIIRQRILQPQQMMGFDIDAQRLHALQNELGIQAASSVQSLVSAADVVLIAVKPQHVADVLQSIESAVQEDTLFISVVAGFSLGQLQHTLGNAPVVRVMPNTPALVGEGVSVLSMGEHVTDEQKQFVAALFSAVGHIEIVEEPLLDAVTGLSGSGPGYLMLIAEALADGGVSEGLPRDVALRLAAYTLRGSGTLLVQALEEGKHPAAVRDQVTSPGGTTARGLETLEEGAVRSAVLQAVRAAALRSRQLGKGE